MCLILGCTGSGKTLLMKRLQAFCHHPSGSSKSSTSSLPSNVVSPTSLSAAAHSGPGAASVPSAGFSLPDAPATVPTVGTNLVKLTLSRKMELTLRELGGCMAPIWTNYLSDCKSLVYVVDLSNPAHVSATCVQILDLLAHEEMAKKPVLIVLNKVDAPSRMRRNTFASIVRLDDIMHHAKQPITVIEVSAMTGVGVGAVQQWLIDNHCGRP